MKIHTSHHVDAGERRPDGGHDYRYEYDLISFQEGAASLVVRTYSSSSEAHFLRAELDSKARPLARADIEGRLATQAVAHLRGLGKTEINWLGDKGYEPVPSPPASDPPEEHRWAQRTPVLLTALRAALAPVVVLLSLRAPWPAAFAACLVTAFLSDIFDGVLARRLGVATANLRRLDSAADTLFYAACVFAAWHLYPRAITERLAPLAVLAVLEATRYAVDFLKFRREASYHMWSSKVWGIALFAGFFSLLVLGSSGAAVSCAIYVGIVADLEGLAISFVLPRWQADIPSLLHALRERRNSSV